MEEGMEKSETLAIKNGESEQPIPIAWRPVIKDIVRALVAHDYRLIKKRISGVTPVSIETAQQIKDYIQDYGAELTELPEEAWASSVCIWEGARWSALVDLWSLAEGRSDLVLSLQVSEAGNGFEFTIYMVYVP